MSTSRGSGRGRGRAGSSLPTEQGAWCGAPSQDPGIMTWAKGRRLTDWATQAPQYIFCLFVEVLTKFIHPSLVNIFMTWLWTRYQVDWLSLFHLVIFLRFYLVLSFGSYFFVSSFGLTFCVCFYELGGTATSPNLARMVLCTVIPCVDRVCLVTLAG